MTSARNEAMIAMRRRQPRPALRAIGLAFGVTRERVRQIFLREEGLQGLPKGELTAVRWTRRIYKCIACGRANAQRRDTSTCRVCHVSPMVTLTCNQCGATFQRHASDIKGSRPTYCDNRCKGRWLGVTHGRGKHK